MVQTCPNQVNCSKWIAIQMVVHPSRIAFDAAPCWVILGNGTQLACHWSKKILLLIWIALNMISPPLSPSFWGTNIMEQPTNYIQLSHESWGYRLSHLVWNLVQGSPENGHLRWETMDKVLMQWNFKVLNLQTNQFSQHTAGMIRSGHAGWCLERKTGPAWEMFDEWPTAYPKAASYQLFVS